MGAKVYTIERNHDIYDQTQKLIEKLALRIVIRCSDGSIGWEEYAPFEGIIVTAGSPSIPINLKKQLAINGRMVIPVGDRRSQTIKIIKKVSEEKFFIEDAPHFAFVPLIGKEGWNENQL
jgi:protein-L-isoaspartate(D-aspartate) O-methyltransferase